MMWKNLNYYLQVCPVTTRTPACCQIVLFAALWIGRVCPKVICSLHKLLQLAGHICQVDDCRARREIHYKVYGCSVKIFGVCTKGHRFIWESSDVITSKAGGRLYLDNLNFASSLILSGNNFHKIMVFAHFYGLHIVGVTTFHGYQRNIICPAVDMFYKKEQVRI